MKVGHFFAGIGGGILASEILGHESVFALEIDRRRCRVLRESGWFPDMHIECADIRNFDPRPWQGSMDCIAAGFPCQDISCAGRGEGIRGERSGLFFELLKTIDHIRPALLFFENSPAIRARGRDVVIKEIVARGYSWRDGTLAAAHVGAGHQRNRWWCLAANRRGKRILRQERAKIADIVGRQHQQPEPQDRRRLSAIGAGRQATDINQIGLHKKFKEPKNMERMPSHIIGNCPPADIDQIGHHGPGQIETLSGWPEFEDSLERSVSLGLSAPDAEAITAAAAYTDKPTWSPPDAGLRRMVDGAADRVDRIAACGDAQVPLQAAVAWMLLTQSHKERQ